MNADKKHGFKSVLNPCLMWLSSDFVVMLGGVKTKDVLSLA